MMRATPLPKVLLSVGATFAVFDAALIGAVAMRYPAFLPYYVPDIMRLLGSQALNVALLTFVVLEPRVERPAPPRRAVAAIGLAAAALLGAIAVGETLLGVEALRPTAAGCVAGTAVALLRPNIRWPTTVEGAALAGILVMLAATLSWDIGHFDALKTFPVELALGDHLWSCLAGSVAAATGAFVLGGRREVSSGASAAPRGRAM